MKKEEFPEIQIPEGLEQRLAARIDRLAAQESARSIRYKLQVACACVACMIMMLVGVSIFSSNDNSTEEQYVLADTFTNPDDAYAATIYALQQLQQGFEKGFSSLEEIDAGYGQMRDAFHEL